MLSTTTRNIGHLGLEGVYVAHVIRIDDEAGSDSYLLGLSFGDGQAIGMVVQHNSNRFRRWAKLSAVEDFLAILNPRVAMIGLYPADGPVQKVKDNLINAYRLDQSIRNDPHLEQERQKLLAALSPERAATHGRDTSSANT